MLKKEPYTSDLTDNAVKRPPKGACSTSADLRRHPVGVASREMETNAERAAGRPSLALPPSFLEQNSCESGCGFGSVPLIPTVE